MLLVFDVGNTNIVVGIYKGNKLLDHWRVSTKKYRTEDEIIAVLNNLFQMNNYKLETIEDIIISSVVPQVMYSLEHLAKKYCNVEPLVIGPGVKTGLNIKYDNPKEVGADRIVNSVSAIEKYGTSLIIVDFGTATTFDVINKKGEYIGGAILPGIKISQDALFNKAAKLTRVELKKPSKVIATNTIESIQSGVIYGYAGSVEYIVRKMKEEMDEEMTVVATGGLSSLMKTATETIDKVDKFLTLDGLNHIYNLNR